MSGPLLIFGEQIANSQAHDETDRKEESQSIT